MESIIILAQCTQGDRPVSYDLAQGNRWTDQSDDNCKKDESVVNKL